jgi:peptidoglycan/xylan/chitin deacetylase (PgdA/CDA1 family)
MRDISFKTLVRILKISKTYKIFQPYYGGAGHILKFHRVIPTSNKRLRLNYDLEVTPDELEKCIIYCLSNDYKIISLDELHNLFQTKERKDLRRFVLFTFDDGYKDCYVHAYPILKKYNIPFSINICPGLIERRSLVWWYLLEDLILNHRHLTVEFGKQKINYKCDSRMEKLIAFRRLRQQLLGSGPEEYHHLLEKLSDRYEPDAMEKSIALLMTWDQVREMSRDPLVTVGTHTDNHLPLSRLPEEKVREEIVHSKEFIEAKINTKVEHFAYPYGHRESGRREFNIVKKLGLKTGVTTRFGNIFVEHYEYLESLPSLYKIGNIRKDKFMDIFTSGAVSALFYKLKRVIAD